MAQGKNRLMLMMALAMPGASQALGLGEIHVDSALNEPLAAEIEIVGASALDLSDISASVASRETFLRFGADRPAFLSSATFKVAQDSKGRPVLAIRSKDAFTEPLVNLVIDLHWHSGELIRQYSLLLDPAGFPFAARAAEALPAVVPPVTHAALAAVLPAASKPAPEAAQPTRELTSGEAQPAPGITSGEAPNTVGGNPAATVAATSATPSAADQAVPRKTVKVGARATLRGVAWRVGSRGDVAINQMMIAIFRANPSAFEGNINWLRKGAVLTIPSAEEAAGISAAEAHREVHAQMQSWRASTKFAGAASAVTAVTAVTAGVAAHGAALHERATPAEATAPSAVASPTEATAATGPARIDAPTDAALDHRVETLEKELTEMQSLLGNEHDKLLDLQARAALAERTTVAAAPPSASEPGHGVASWIVAALALTAVPFGLLHAWRRRRTLDSNDSSVPGKTQVPDSARSAARAAPSDPVRPGAHADPDLQLLEMEAQMRAAHEQRKAAGEAWARERENLGAKVLDDIEAKTLESSYILEGSGGVPDDGATIIAESETVTLPAATQKIRMHDANAETMPLQAVGSAARELAVGERSATLRVLQGEELNVDTTQLDYNLTDLDATVQHVHLPSMLHEPAGIVERRTSLVDVLKKAIEREPDRRDLRIKLLETYYSAAASNRQGFLDEVAQLARERERMPDGEWAKIALMGKHIASDSELFAAERTPSNEEDLANCA